MEIPIIQIGNSKGIRLSKTILEQYQMEDKVELVLEDGFLVIKPIRKPREGWGEAFRQMHENGEDELLIPDVFEDEIIED